MGKNLMLILGNGFTIDFVQHIGKADKIDVYNLFSKGDKIPWVADGEPGFLSYKRCPNLWALGARTNMQNKDAGQLIEDIITCAHIYITSIKTSSLVNATVYIKAYNELIAYLRYLFAYYNSLIGDDDYRSAELKEWGWYKFFEKLSHDTKFEKIYIITYNYDIFLERLLNSLDIKFDVAGFSDTGEKVVLMKPHGSISFCHQRTLEDSQFSINHGRIASAGDITDLKVDYDRVANHTLVNPMIPPLGESGRFGFGWTSPIKDATIKHAKSMVEGDEVIICGLSYWHVDRLEIDEILLNFEPKVNLRVINPSTSSTLNAVISSIFPNYINYSDASQIEKIF